VKSLTSSLKVKVKVTGPVAVAPGTLSVMTTVGATLSVDSPPPQALRIRAAAKAPADSLNGLARHFIDGAPDWIWIIKIEQWKTLKAFS